MSETKRPHLHLVPSPPEEGYPEPPQEPLLDGGANNPDLDAPNTQERTELIQNEQGVARRGIAGWFQERAKKLKEKEEVSRSTAQRELYRHDNKEVKREVEDYLHPVTAISRFLAQKRKNKSRRARNRAFKAYEKELIYGSVVTKDIPDLKTRRKGGERITRKDHRAQKKVQRQRERYQKGSILGADTRRASLETVADRETVSAKFRQSRIGLYEHLADNWESYGEKTKKVAKNIGGAAVYATVEAPINGLVWTREKAIKPAAHAVGRGVKTAAAKPKEFVDNAKQEEFQVLENQIIERDKVIQDLESRLAEETENDEKWSKLNHLQRELQIKQEKAQQLYRQLEERGAKKSNKTSRAPKNPFDDE